MACAIIAHCPIMCPINIHPKVIQRRYCDQLPKREAFGWQLVLFTNLVTIAAPIVQLKALLSKC